MARTVKAKWGVSKDTPEDLPDFLSNDEIVEKMGGVHPRGAFRLLVKGTPKIVANKNNDDMIKMTLEINDPRKEKSGYNGYACWEQQNITEQGKPFILKWLKALGVTWAQFLNADTIPATKLDPSELAGIGPVKFNGTKKVYLEAVLGKDNRPEYENSRVVRWIPKEEAASDDEVADAEVEVEVEDEDVEVEDEDTDTDTETSDEEAELREELDALKPMALKKRMTENAEELEEEVPDIKGTAANKERLIAEIVRQEIGGDEEADEEADEADEEDKEAELREELSDTKAWTLAKLKARAKNNGHKLLELKKITDRDELIEMIVEDEAGAEGDDNEPPF